MSRIVVNFLLDAALLVIALGVIWTTCLLRIIFPSGPQADGWNLWGMNYNQWFNAQVCLLGALALAVLIHIMLHWNWVCSVITTRLLRRSKKMDDGAQTLYGVGALIFVVILTVGLLIAAELTIRRPAASAGATSIGPIENKGGP